MSLKEFIPAIKYGRYLASDEFDSDAVISTKVSIGTTTFIHTSVGSVTTGDFTIGSDALILGYYPIASTGSPSWSVIKITQSGTTGTWTSTDAQASGSVTYQVVYINAS